jgi:hypothetical protein
MANNIDGFHFSNNENSTSRIGIKKLYFENEKRAWEKSILKSNDYFCQIAAFAQAEALPGLKYLEGEIVINPAAFAIRSGTIAI